MVELREEAVPLDKLLLDPNNYRFQDAPDFVAASEDRFGEQSVQSKATARLREEGLLALKNSILHNGFLPFERIVVREFNGKFLVVEGNRRVAALKWIAQDDASGVEVPGELRKVFSGVPVIVLHGIEDDPSLALSLMGVRHVGGIREWGGYQRAKLVTELRDNFGFDTGEVAARLGMTGHEVNRRYRAFKALQQMVMDEEYGDVSEPDMYPLFHEAISGTAVKQWLGWNEAAARFDNIEAVQQFYSLVTPSRGEDGVQSTPPKIATYQGVRDLREILPVPEARRRLLDPESSFAEALALAKADDLARTWLAQVSEATSALKTLGALELKNLPPQELEAIRELGAVVSEVLAAYTALQASAAPPR